jgi:hypothetical protein
MANFLRNFLRGRMNKVYDERIVPEGEYIDAMNVRMGSTEKAEVGVIENTKGNTQLTNLSFLGEDLSTDAVCIGAFEDSANETIYWFVHDPNNNLSPTGKVDAIISFNTVNTTLIYHIISVQYQNTTETNLNFNPKYLITSVNKVSNLIFFTDNYNPPRFINITRQYPFDIFGADYRESILVIKKPPIFAPRVTLTSVGNENNYLEERFVSFAYRYRYADGEYSATSLWSDIAFSPKPFDFNQDSMVNEGMVNAYNGAIVEYFTGGPLVVGIDLLFKDANNNVIKIIEKLDKDVLGISDNIFQSFLFDNSKIFTVLPEVEILRLYDNVPRYAQSQTIMGNRLMYGNYVEGYDLIDKFGIPTNLTYEAKLNKDVLSTIDINTGAVTTTYNISGQGAKTVTNGELVIDLNGINLTQGSVLTIEFTFQHSSFSGNATPNEDTPSTNIVFTFTLPTTYASPYDMVQSNEFRIAIGQSFTNNIKPVYFPIPNTPTSCLGSTLTDIFNCSVSDTLNDSVWGTLVKVASIDGEVGCSLNSPPWLPTYCGIGLSASPSFSTIGFRLPVMYFVDDPSNIAGYAYEYYQFTGSEAYIQTTSSARSLHSNRGYEIGIVYMDEFLRSSTALVSPYNTVHVPCSASDTVNSIYVDIPTSQRAPAWAKWYKFVCKADTAEYETIYVQYYFIDSSTGMGYFLLEGENAQKIQNGDRLIVKKSASGVIDNCVYVTVLEKASKSAGFIVTTTGDVPPAGVYMKMAVNDFNAVIDNEAVIDFGNSSMCAGSTDYAAINYLLGYTDPNNPGMYLDYNIPIGSEMQISGYWNRTGPGSGNNNCERRRYTLVNATLVANNNYNNIYDWWVAEAGNVDIVINSGTPEVGDNQANPDNIFVTTLLTVPNVTTNDYQTGVLENFWQFNRSPTTNLLSLIVTGTIACGNNENRRSCIENFRIQLFRADVKNTLIFETLPKDTLPDVFFENNLIYPIDNDGNHLSNFPPMIYPGNIAQDIPNGIPGRINTGFFNCFCFGNGAESYKIRDSILGRTFNLGNRVTTVAAQNYKESRRTTDITYSGVYNEETNVNKLNEFNLGLFNFKRLEVSFGPIQKIDARQNDVLVLQEDKISYVLTDKNLLSDSAGGSIISAAPEVLGTQIARTEKYGISNNPESYVRWGMSKYFTDVKRGAVIRLTGSDTGQENLEVVSEFNMRTWFRDTFIDTTNKQKLGGFDPYMNEYVLSITDRSLPSDLNCLECGTEITIQANIPAGKSNIYEYCFELGQSVGQVDIDYDVKFSVVSQLGPVSIQSTYNNITSNNPLITSSGSGSFTFNKDLAYVQNVSVEIEITGSATVTFTVKCPDSTILEIIEVVLTSDIDTGKTIHTQYQYIDSPYVSPLQSNYVTFLNGSGIIVSRYNSVTGLQGQGSFPINGSTVKMITNRIVPDTYNPWSNISIPPYANMFRYLRTMSTYPNTTSGINGLLTDALLATIFPINVPNQQVAATFTMPTSGDRLYLIWDLRQKSKPEELCFLDKNATPEELSQLCCECSICEANCYSVVLVNTSSRDSAIVFFPNGMCSDSIPFNVELEPSETSTPICIKSSNDFIVVSGNVQASLDECNCDPTPPCNCQTYIAYATGNGGTVYFTECNGSSVSLPIIKGDSETICCQSSTIPTTSDPNLKLFLDTYCNCCAIQPTCLNYLVTYGTNGQTYIVYYDDCDGNPVTFPVSEGAISNNFCVQAGSVPSVSASSHIVDFDIELLSGCNGCNF